MDRSTKQKIKDALIDRLNQKEFNLITVTDICNTVPMARTTFYNYYQNTIEIRSELENEIINGFLLIYKEFADTDFSKFKIGETIPILEETLFYIKSNFKIFKAFLGKYPNNVFIYKWKIIIKDSFKKIWTKEKIEFSNMDLMLEMTASAIIGVYTYWLEHESDIEIITFAKELSTRNFIEIYLKHKNL